MMAPKINRKQTIPAAQNRGSSASGANNAVWFTGMVVATLAIGALGWSFQRIASAAERAGTPSRAQQEASQKAPATQTAAAANIPAAKLVEPEQIAGTLTELESKEKTPVVCVGFKFLYESAHIPGALYLGPARTAEGLDALQKWAQKLPRNKTVVIYCGCCPWDKCPNISPAYAALQKMGFTNVKVMHVAQDFGKDWVDKGYPIEKTAAGDSTPGNPAGTAKP